ncbi:hypothetical protein [Halomarina ordinaria]|uniref:Uncharacterized protein n=1 Tax=Halomarina ordinaria TaxID=3033939 RepID=A0ABD5U9L8_9EURY|nr:hypothetical protein [Halomarina sp. PSRA2]
MVEKGEPLPLVPGVELTLTSTDDGVSVRVTEPGPENERRVIYSSTQSRTFYTSDLKRGTIANKLRDGVSEGIDGDAVAGAFHKVCSTLDARHDEVAKALQAPVVTQLLDETDEVHFYRAGRNGRIVIKLTREDHHAKIEFTPGEWVRGATAKLEEQYVAAFFPAEVDVEDEHWNELKAVWREVASVIEGDDYDSIDAISDDVLSRLRNWVSVPFDTREALDRAPTNVVHEEDVSNFDALDTTGPVVWVQGEAIRDCVSDVGSHKLYPEIISRLRERGDILGPQKRIGNHRVYPFTPTLIEYDPENLATIAETRDEPERFIGRL